MKLTAVRKGEPIQMPASGTFGIVREPAPSDGFSWDDGDPEGTCGFLSEKDLADALLNLKMLRRNGWRVKR